MADPGACQMAISRHGTAEPTRSFMQAQLSSLTPSESDTASTGAINALLFRASGPLRATPAAGPGRSGLAR